MHIPENYLSPTTCAAMGAVMLTLIKKRFLCWESGLPCPSLS